MECKVCKHVFYFRDNFELKRHIKTKRHFDSSKLNQLVALYEKFSNDKERWKQDVIMKAVVAIN